jgi:hypothetical protein
LESSKELASTFVQEQALVTWLQYWTDALFLHFAVRADELEPLVPPRVEIDTFDGQAWLSFVFFRLKLRPAGLPFIPVLSSLLEMNVRTYVRHRGQAGICFLRMYADNRLAIRAARWLTPLCYEPATMIDRRLSDSRRHVECRPTGDRRGWLSVDFTTAGSAEEAFAPSLPFWLLERYRLFVDRGDGAIMAADVEHPPWRASSVETLAVKHSFGDALGLTLGQWPAAGHFSAGVAARFNTFRMVAEARPMIRFAVDGQARGEVRRSETPS